MAGPIGRIGDAIKSVISKIIGWFEGRQVETKETGSPRAREEQEAPPKVQQPIETSQNKAPAKTLSERTSESGTAGLGKSIGGVSGQETLNQVKAAEAGSLSKIEGLALESERQALDGLSEKAIPEGVTLENLPEGKDAEWLYDFQMGRIDADGNEMPHPDETEIIRFVKMHNMLPSELLAKSDLPEESADFINAAWLNQAYVDTYNDIEDINEKGIYGVPANFSNRGLIALPANIGKSLFVTYLQIDNNKLTALPPEIGNLTNLTDLKLESNKLTALPPEIGNLKNLIHLVGKNNKLTALPPEIGNLIKLRNLYLQNNKITSLPPEIGNLKNLENLDLSFNKITSLPPEFKNLKLQNLTF